MQDLIKTLEVKYGTDVELREGARSVQRDYSYEGMPSLRSGGFYVDAFGFAGESVTVEKTTVGNTSVFILSFSVCGTEYEARVGQAALDAKLAEEAVAKAAAEKANEEKAAAAAQRKSRTEPSSFHFEGKLVATDAEVMNLYVEAPAGTFVVGDRVTVPGRRAPFPPREVVVTGLGREFDNASETVQRAYVMLADKYDALSEADRERLPKDEGEVLKARADTSKKAAKVLGGKALKGTARQKAWAEEIRKEALSKVPEATAEKLLSGAKFQSAGFWIENRSKLSTGNVAGLL